MFLASETQCHIILKPYYVVNRWWWGIGRYDQCKANKEKNALNELKNSQEYAKIPLTGENDLNSK